MENLVTVSCPFVICFIWFLTFLILPRDGFAYVLARVVQASCEVLALATNGMIVGEREPMMAFKIN